MTKTFRGHTAAEATAKAETWVAAQDGLRNVRCRCYMFRSAFSDEVQEEGKWTVAVDFDEAEGTR